MNQQGNTAAKNRDPQWTILKLLTWTTSYFETNQIEQARTDAEILLAHLLGLRRIDLYVQHEKPLTQQELSDFRSMVKRRAKREPVAYILGVKEFWSMGLEMAPGVLIPRPETECLVEAVLDVFNDKGEAKRVLELGTGTGAISLALAREMNTCRFFALDQSARAVALAQKNAKRHKLDQSIAFFCGDWFSALPMGEIEFDLIVSNPPYIRRRDLDTLQPEIRNYEPMTALNGGVKGLDCIAHIIQAAPAYLRPGGWVMLEIGYDQWPDILTITDTVNDYDEVVVKQDYSGLDRIAQLRKKHTALV